MSWDLSEVLLLISSPLFFDLVLSHVYVLVQGGQSVHTSPAAHVADCGSLLTAAGFSLPTVDQDTIRISYPNAFVLMEHLQVFSAR